MKINRVYFETVGSTNTWAKEHVGELDQESLTIIVADSQTAGRGRFKRQWISPKGCNLYVTYVFFVDHLQFSLGNLPQILALAAYQVLHPLVYGIAIKWPNDLVVGVKKLGGILCELVGVGEKYAVVIGLGVNINMSKEELEAVDRPATSLKELIGKDMDRKEITEAIHISFQDLLTVFLKQGFTPFLEPFRRALLHRKGDKVVFSDFQSLVEGYFEEVDSEGALILKLKDGSSLRCTSGELPN